MNKPALLVLATLLNGALVASVLFQRSHATVAAAPVIHMTAAAAPASPKRKAAAVPVETVETMVSTNDFSWSELETDDYRDYIARLRGVGCPEQTVRDIIIADVNAQYGRKLAALQPDAGEYKFWQTNERESRSAQIERAQQAADLQREKRELIHSLLGVDLDQELALWEGRVDPTEQRYNFLASDKQTQLKALIEKYREMGRAVLGDTKRSKSDNRAQYNALMTQMDAEVARLLTPTELEEYQLRTSGTASTMREQLVSFQPSQEEFRDIYKLQKAFADQSAALTGSTDPAAREQQRILQQQLDSQLQTLLGVNRYQEYTLAQDERYRDIYVFGRESGLSSDQIKQLYEVRVAAEAERRRIERNRKLPNDQKRALLANVSRETRSAVSHVLGPTAYSTYRQQSSGTWMSRLSRL